MDAVTAVLIEPEPYPPPPWEVAPSRLNPGLHAVATWLDIAHNLASGLVSRQDQDDLVQDTLLKLWSQRTLVAHLTPTTQARWIERIMRHLATATSSAPSETNPPGECRCSAIAAGRMAATTQRTGLITGRNG